MAEKIQMPQSGGGLLRYSDDYHSKIQISPMSVVWMIVVIIMASLVLHIIG